MPEHVHYIDSKRDRDVMWHDFPITVEYNIFGGYERATQTSPAEYPEVEFECFRMDKELADLLGISEVLDSDKVEKYIDIDELADYLLQVWREDQEPDY